MVERIGKGIVKGLMSYLTKPLAELIKLLIPAEIGKFMMADMPQLVGKAVVGPVTHTVVHATTRALGHGLSRSLTTTVSHSLMRAQAHFYYCLYCYYHGAYCQYCEFYDEYAQLGTKAQGGAAQTEAERLRRSAKARSGGFVGSKPFESRWDQEEVCSVHFRPVECAEKPLGAKDLGPPGGEICAACPPAAEGAAADEKAITELIDENNRFASCPDAEIAKTIAGRATVCAIPADAEPSLPRGLRMKFKLVAPGRPMGEGEGGGGFLECSHEVCGSEKDVFENDPTIREHALRSCREQLDNILIRSQYQRFLVCVEMLDQQERHPE